MEMIRRNEVTTIRCGAVQFTHRAGDKAYNLSVIEPLAAEAAAAGTNYLFVMTYDSTPEKAFAARGDFSGGGGAPGHHTNLHASPATEGYGADAMVRTPAEAGVPRAKMVIGAAFFAGGMEGGRLVRRHLPGGNLGRAVRGGGRGPVTPPRSQGRGACPKLVALHRDHR